MDDGKGLSLLDLVRILKENIIIIIAIVFFATIMGGVYAFNIATPTYTAQTKAIVMVDKTPTGGVSTTDYDITTAQKMVESVALFMKDGLVIDAVLKDEDVIAAANLADIALSNGYISGNLSASGATTNFYVTVRFNSTDAHLAGMICNSVVENAIKIGDEKIAIFKNVIVQTAEAVDGSYASPNKTVIVIVSFILGIIASLGVALIREMANTKINNKEKLESITGVKNIGLLPEFNSAKVKELRYDLQEKSNEFYEKLLVNLDYASIDNALKIIQVSSSVEQEGKTLTVLNLAWLNARRNKRCLVIDLDLRKPTAYKGLKMKNDVGIVDYLAGKTAIDKMIKKSDLGVDLITTGSKSPFIIDLLSSNKIDEMINELRDKYDYIYIDTPPIMVAADAIITSKYADAVLFIVSSKNVRKSVLIDSLKQLKNVKANIIGTCFTDVKEHDYRKYYYYGAYHKYGMDSVGK